MDTLELAFDDVTLATRLLQRLSPLGPSLRYRDKDGKVSNGRYGYRQQRYYEPYGKDFYFAFDRWHCSYPEVLVQIHLSQFRTFDEALLWLQLIFGEDYPQIWTALIKRLDLCVDLPVPFETVRGAVIQPKARRQTAYDANGIRSLYLGKQPRQTCVYEKSIEPDLADYQPPNKAAPIAGKGTRIEVRLTKGKLPIRYLSEVDQLRGYSPFAHLRLLQMDEALITPLQGNARNRVLAYLRQRDLYGAQAARREFNQQRNFSKTIGRYLGKLDLDLGLAWQTRIDRFLGPMASKGGRHE